MEFKVITFNGYNGPRDQMGQCSVELVFSVRGEAGAIVWRLATGITPKGPTPNGYDFLYDVNLGRPSDMGLSFHAELTPETALDIEASLCEKCDYLEGRACVSTYLTGLAGKELFPAFACEGFDGVRKILEKKYGEYVS